MKVFVMSVGTVKEKYLKDAIAEYEKRISRFSKIQFITVDDEPISENPYEKEILAIKEKEGEKLIRMLPKDCYNIALNLQGTMLSSEELAAKLENVFCYHKANVCFVIGGSLGLGQNILAKMDYHLCFSKMTFPHQLMKVILLEQIYRAFKINNHETYHK